MKVLQFAFDGNPDNPHLPRAGAQRRLHRHHDNDTTVGWWEHLDEQT